MKSNTKYLIIVLLFSVSLFADDKIFNLGIQNYSDVKIKINKKSLNDHIEDLFKNDLKLNIKEIKNTRDENYKSLKEERIDAVNLILKNNYKSLDNIVLSEPLFIENLYIASKLKRLESYKDLENEIIYYKRNDKLALELLKDYIKENKIHVDLIPVEDITKYENAIYLDSEFEAIKAQNRLLISYLGPVCIGVNKSYSYLIPKVNNLLKGKYREKIVDYIDHLPSYYQRQRFLEKLTTEEKIYLENKKEIITALEDDITLSIYLKEKKSFIGILPSYIKKISDIIGVPIISEIYPSDDFSTVLSEFKNGKYKFLTLSETTERKKDYIFTKEVDYIPMYLMNHKKSNNNKVGVLKDGKSHDIGNSYFPEEDIITYSSTYNLFKGITNNEVGYIITPYPLSDFNCLKEHKDTKIKNISINFAFRKEDVFLKNIFDKAISVVGDIDRVQARLESENNQKENLLIIKKKQKKNEMIIFLGIVIITPIIFLLLLKILLQKNLTKVLKYDQLTHLQNRYLFNEVCQKKDYENGIVIVIDLDNFKNANDIYGHSIGDSILKEMALILLKVFPKENSFRISGDEFYLFYQEKDFIDKAKELLKYGKESAILKKYNVYFSIGYYMKTNKENLEKAFEKADKAMYEAKKIKGFSIKEFKE